MTVSERAVLVRTAGAILLAGVLRWGVEAAQPAPAPPALHSDLPRMDSLVRVAAEDEARRSAPLGDGERIDPNRADEVELDRLPGVGPAMARAIVASREAEGPYAAPEDLIRVRGVGPATLERLRSKLDFARPPAFRASARGPEPPGAQRIALSTATAADLEGLTGIGPVLASRIIESRDREGPFRTVDELLRVGGIGPSLLERVRPYVRP